MSLQVPKQPAGPHADYRDPVAGLPNAAAAAAAHDVIIVVVINLLWRALGQNLIVHFLPM